VAVKFGNDVKTCRSVFMLWKISLQCFYASTTICEVFWSIDHFILPQILKNKNTYKFSFFWYQFSFKMSSSYWKIHILCRVFFFSKHVKGYNIALTLILLSRSNQYNHKYNQVFCILEFFFMFNFIWNNLFL